MDAENECSGSSVGPSPSFSTYSAGSLSDAALRVSGEAAAELEIKIGAIDLQDGNDIKEHSHGDEDDDDDDDDDDFEFVSLIKNSGEVTIGGGWTAPVFPVFNRDLVYGDDGRIGDEESDREEDERPLRIPLKSLFMADRDPASCSSSEADELEAIPEGTYCVWTPQTQASPSPSRCKKSNSTGSCSKRWRFRDLLKRSNSDGKDAYVFLTPSSSSSSSSSAKLVTSISSRNPSAVDAKVAEKPSKKPAKVSAHEEFYVRSRALKEGDKRRSYLPYRKDLVGFFANVNNGGNGWGRTFPPF